MSKVPTNRVPISVGVPFNFISLIDKFADEEGLSRSEFVFQAVKEKVEKLQAQ